MALSNYGATISLSSAEDAGFLRDDRTDYSGFRAQRTRLMVALVEEVGLPPAAAGERGARGVQKAPSSTLCDACLKAVQAHDEGATPTKS